jgi:hypothetical protein
VGTGEKAGYTHPSKRQRLLPSRDPAPEPCHNKAGSSSDSDGDDKLINKIDSDDHNREPRPTKQKRPSSPEDSPTSKKRKYHL